MKKAFVKLSIVFLILSGFVSKAQYELEVLERYTNSFQNKEPKGEVYLVIGFSEDYCQYFFNKDNMCLLRLVKNGKEDKLVNKSEFFKNPKTKMWEFYHFISKASDVDKADVFDLYLASPDSTNFTKVSFSEKDRNKIVNVYKMPDDNASSKEKLKYYKKTGDRQGQLMGQAKIVEIHRRMKCSAKKRKYRKEGINGTKEMIYGF